MQHIAIMKKSWGLVEKILSGQKVIESRWYSVRCKPWNAVKAGDVVYFKNSGEAVQIKAKVNDVVQFENLSPKKVKEILAKYGKGIGIEKSQMLKYFKMFKNKKYCILVFLKDPVKITPFEINKTGFGAMSAWVSVKNIQKLRR